MIKKRLMILLIILLSPVMLFAVEKDDIVGLWFMQEDKGDRGIAEVFENNGKYYAIAIAFESYLYADADNDTIIIQKDVNNPNQNLRNRALNEMVFINEISFDGEEWTDGEIYNHANGKYYYLYGTLKNGDLIWKGSIDRLGVFGAKTTWKKIDNVTLYNQFRRTETELKALIPNKRYK